MAPATHSCNDDLTLDSDSNSGGCDDDDAKYRPPILLPISRPFPSRLGTLAPAPRDVLTLNATLLPRYPTTQIVYPDSSPPKSILKEPAFIAAVALTVVILIGGIVVTKLSNTPLLSRRKRLQVVPAPLPRRPGASGHGGNGTMMGQAASPGSTNSSSCSGESAVSPSPMQGPMRSRGSMAMGAGSSFGGGTQANEHLGTGSMTYANRFGAYLPAPEYTPSPLFNVVTAIQSESDLPQALDGQQVDLKRDYGLTGAGLEREGIHEEEGVGTRAQAPPQIVFSEPDDDDAASTVGLDHSLLLARARVLDSPPPVPAKDVCPRSPPRSPRTEPSPTSPLQGQDAPTSNSSDTSHTGTLPDTSLFSSTGSLSYSMSSSCSSGSTPGEVHDYDSGVDDDLDYAGMDMDASEYFEVKRGQTQSLELVKGVLLNLPRSSTSSDIVKRSSTSYLGSSRGDISILATSSDESSSVHDNGKDVLKASTARSPTGMLNTSTIDVPALIVTQPSTLSLFTVASSTSNISIDLAQFPLPPLHLEPAVFWAKLEDEINSSLALKHCRSRPVPQREKPPSYCIYDQMNLMK